ncbi:MAG: DUF3014 domain-containing protein [Rhodocyclales bacterium]|nr:DUF3014 domain-containing protein [Rhodocyclales bacterium]
MNKKLWGSVLAVLAIAVVGVWYFWQRSATMPPPEPAVPVAERGAVSAQTEVPALPPPAPRATPRHPLTGSAASGAPGGSAGSLLDTLRMWLGQRVLALLFSDELVHRIVKTVDNLPRVSLPPESLPLKPVPGAFATAGKGDTLVIAGRNAARYAAYVRIVRAMDAHKLVGIYVDFYPVFQRTYEELVNRNDAYFNDRLVEAIDDMLAAPDPAGPVRLLRVGGHYEYADADFAARSAGQKILLRMGVANASAVKAKLTDIRREIVRDERPPPAAAGGTGAP